MKTSLTPRTLVFDITSIFGDAVPEITIVDIGAMDVGETASFQPLLDGGWARLVGFEPIEEECARLNRDAPAYTQYLPCFIGDGGPRPFYITRAPMSSSLYEPNLPLLRRFQHLEEYMQVARTVDVQTRRLDDITEIGDVDLLKVDVDGGELDVFSGAERTLHATVAVQTEVHFVPLYQGAPLFADIDRRLRECGFLFHRLEGHAGRALKPLLHAGDPFRGFGQWLWGDAIYLKDFTRFGELSPEKLLKLAVILHEAYRAYDFAALALQHHDAITGGGLRAHYLRSLAEGTSAAA